MPQDATEQQLHLADIGIDELPVGMAALTGKEQRFIVEFVRNGGLAAPAARAAGYSDPEADATKIRRKPKIAAILAQIARAASVNAVTLVTRVSQRSQAAHYDWDRERNKPEGLRDTTAEIERLNAANNTDKILGSLLGLDKLKVESDVTFHGLTEEQLAHMRELQAGLEQRERQT